MARIAFGRAIAAAGILLAAAWAQAADKAERGNRWAILIGVDEYNELRKLRFAGNDERALAEQLIASGFPRDQVFLIHDKATENKYRPFRENIQKHLELVLGLADQGDLVIVGFSGHGVQVEGKSYFCPVDTRLDDVAATSIQLDSVYAQLARSKASMKLLLVDACRNDLVPTGRRGVAVVRSLGEFGGTKEKPPEGIMLLSSCGPGQVSLEDEKFQHGVFMHFLLQGLQGQAANSEGAVSLAGLYDYASLQTKKYVAREHFEHQTPALKGELTGPFEIHRVPQTKQLINSLGMKLVLIPPGEFMMGSRESSDELARAYAQYKMFDQYDPEPKWFDCEHPLHRVQITKPFYLAAHHATVGQFRRFVTDTGYVTDAEKATGPKGRKGADGVDPATGKWIHADYSWRNAGFEQTEEHPVANVSWNDAMAFCGWLSRKEGKTYRLPTEAEWEYACRAGTTTRYHCGDDLEGLAQVANVADAAVRNKFGWQQTIGGSDGFVFTSPVGSLRPNAFGLYDMHGNVWQWCMDWYDKNYYSRSPVEDPTGPDSGRTRVLRGGAWFDRPHLVRSASRIWGEPSYRDTNSGFRIARQP